MEPPEFRNLYRVQDIIKKSGSEQLKGSFVTALMTESLSRRQMSRYFLYSVSSLSGAAAYLGELQGGIVTHASIAAGAFFFLALLGYFIVTFARRQLSSYSVKTIV